MSVSCKDYENDLLGYLDRRLDPATRARFEGHIASCDACRREARRLEKTWKMVGYHPGWNLSGKIPAAAIEAARLQLLVERRWTHRVMKQAPWIASAAVMLLVFTVTMFYRPGPGPESDLDPILQGLSDEERAIVRNLDLYENFGPVDQYEAISEDGIVENLDVVQNVSDEDF